jgi:dTDP-4-amino-4,6-dideoxygalactose transaminase
MRDHGFSGPDTVVRLGLNGKMDELSAAVGLALLNDVDELIAVQKRHHARYRDGLRDLPGVHVLVPDADTNHQYVVVEIDGHETGVERDTLMRVLRAENVHARRYFYPGVHRMEPYASSRQYAGLVLPRTEAVCGRVLCLPTGAAVSADDIDQVCERIRFVVAHGREIEQRLGVA